VDRQDLVVVAFPAENHGARSNVYLCMLNRLKSCFYVTLASLKEANTCYLETVMVAVNFTFAESVTSEFRKTRKSTVLTEQLILWIKTDTIQRPESAPDQYNIKRSPLGQIH